MASAGLHRLFASLFYSTLTRRKLPEKYKQWATDQHVHFKKNKRQLPAAGHREKAGHVVDGRCNLGGVGLVLADAKYCCTPFACFDARALHPQPLPRIGFTHTKVGAGRAPRRVDVEQQLQCKKQGTAVNSKTLMTLFFR